MPSDRVTKVLASIAANVVRLRHRVGLTQEQLSEEAGLELRFLQKVERGKPNISVGTLVQLADALGVNPKALLTLARLRPARRGRPPHPAAGDGGSHRRTASSRTKPKVRTTRS
jgi:transcriptional regulator with XRE-family HTH domain